MRKCCTRSPALAYLTGETQGCVSARYPGFVEETTLCKAQAEWDLLPDQQLPLFIWAIFPQPVNWKWQENNQQLSENISHQKQSFSIAFKKKKKPLSLLNTAGTGTGSGSKPLLRAKEMPNWGRSSCSSQIANGLERGLLSLYILLCFIRGVNNLWTLIWQTA